MTLNKETERLVRESIKGIVPYRTEKYPQAVKLDANENPFDFPPEIWRQINKMIGPQTFNRYPDETADDLVRNLAACYEVEPEKIMAGNGSDELILDLMLAFGAGNRIVIAVPTFSMYGIHAKIAGAEIVEVPRLENFDLDVDELVRAGSGAGLVVVCSPNNPTGNSAGTEHLETLAKNCRCPVVVDQAYVEFGGKDFLQLFKKYENLVILRTFSKAYGLAGLRVGYLFAWPPVMEYLYKVKQPYNLNVFSQKAALAVISCRDAFKEQVALISKEKEKLYAAMQELAEVQVYPSDANFLMFRTVYPAAELHQGLLKNNVLIRNFGDPALREYLRVSVGRPQENDIFLRSLQKVIATLGEKK